jgi:hypothetical protein
LPAISKLAFCRANIGDDLFILYLGETLSLGIVLVYISVGSLGVEKASFQEEDKSFVFRLPETYPCLGGHVGKKIE